MGARVIIGATERDLDNIEPNWVAEQIRRRRHDRSPVCVKIIINQGDINLALATSDCPSSPSGRRQLTGPEREVVGLWNKLHLSENQFSAGNLIAFIKQLKV